MSVIFYRGQQLGREDLTIFFTNSNGTPANAAEITYALYDFTTGLEVLVGPPQRVPQNPAVGEYFASLLIPLDANQGLYRIRWTFREVIGGPVQQVVQEFTLQDRNAPSPTQQTYSSAETDLIRRFRILLRDNCVAGEEEVELDVDGERMVITMEDLWESVHDVRPAEKIRNAFSSRNLKVRSVSPEGTLEWRPVLAVHRAEVPSETIVEIKTTHGPMTLTGGHRVFVSPTQKVEAEQLLVGQTVCGLGSTRTVVQVMRVPNRRYMYDLTADEWHNFILYRSGVLISNSPDRNYRFRPPAHEKTVNQFNQVFGYIWEDDELKEYLERSLDSISLAPPYTPFQSIDNLVSRYPAWRTLLLTGGMIHALQAVRLNWISEEFSLVPNTLVRVILPSGEQVDLSIQDLYDTLWCG